MRDLLCNGLLYLLTMNLCILVFAYLEKLIKGVRNFIQMENGISGHYSYNKKRKFWAVIDGHEEGYLEADLPDLCEYPIV